MYLLYRVRRRAVTGYITKNTYSLKNLLPVVTQRVKIIAVCNMYHKCSVGFFLPIMAITAIRHTENTACASEPDEGKSLTFTETTNIPLVDIRS